MKLHRIAVVCLALCLVGSAVPFADAGEIPSIIANAEEAPTSGTCGENVNWNFDTETGTLTISGTGEMEYVTSPSLIPWDSYKKSIKEVVIEEGVTSIGNSAISYCPLLTSIVLPKGITSIGSFAFYNCESLTSINIPDTVTTIESSAFYNCKSLTSINIPEGVTKIGKETFFSCKSLESVSIPESVTNIEYQAFFNCSSLTSISIPNTVTDIGDYAFSSCTALTSIDIPEGVTKIGLCAFSNCISATSVNIPESVTYIQDGAFANCSSLVSINVDGNNTRYCDIDGVLYDKAVYNLVCHPAGRGKEYIIPDGVLRIQNSAFYGCNLLTSIVIPDGVTQIGRSAFAKCTSLTSITIPDGVKVIQSCTFISCTSLTSIEIPNSVEKIETYAFYNCNLSSLTIPESTKFIYEGAFDRCGNNTTITILNPECGIIVSNGFSASKSDMMNKVIIYGYENTMAQTYFTTEANNNPSKTEYEFRIIGQEYPEDKISGDLNDDGKLTDSDIQEFSQKLGKREALPKNCDLNGDGIVNVIDLALLKRALRNQSS